MDIFKQAVTQGDPDMNHSKHEQADLMRERGFTLTELMTVLATFAVVALVVLPALARSNNGSVRAVCFNNLRQMGMAVGMYADDNTDYLAFCNWDGGQTTTPGWLYKGAIPDPTQSPFYPNNIAGAYAGGLWFKYINDPKAYLCPLDIQSKFYSYRVDKLCSYVMNGSPNGFSNDGAGTTCKVTDAWNPGCYLLWEPDDTGLGGFVFNDGAVFPATSDGPPSKLHTLNGTEFLCVGGNVTFVSTNQFRAQSLASGRSLAWWRPTTTTGH
jgi:prepilin-type N-terminal cleavage/methylation domain-containing protein